MLSILLPLVVLLLSKINMMRDIAPEVRDTLDQPVSVQMRQGIDTLEQKYKVRYIVLTPEIS